MLKAFVSANIPLKKLENTTFRNFLEKHMQRKLPSETTIRKNYLDNAKNDVLIKIRADIGDNPIYVSIDETTDKEGR